MAEALHQQALTLRRQVLGEQHADVATSLNNLAQLYQSIGSYAAAEPLYQQAQAITQEALAATSC